MRAYILFIFLLFIGILINNCSESTQSSIKHGMLIEESIVFETDTFYLENHADKHEAAIRITGNDIVVDFNHSLLIGSSNKSTPDLFKGLGIEILNGKNITIKNIKVQGYHTGLIAKAVSGLKIINADFSHNYRPKIEALSEQKDGYSNRNEKEILQLGVAVYLEACDSFLIEASKIQQVSQGLVLNQCNNGTIYKNTFTYNTQSGISLINSLKNKIIGNRIDWNVAGFNFGKKARDLNAAGIQLDQNSIENIIAYNSITHNEKAIASEDQVKNAFEKNRIANNNLAFEVFKDSSFNISLEAISENIPFFQTVSEKYNLREFPKLDQQYTGYKHMLMDTYGPYNFQYPFICTRSQAETEYTLAIFGPFGNFKVTGGKGLTSISKKRGALPVTLVLKAQDDAQSIELEVEYIGSAFTDAFDIYHKKGIPYKLFWQAETIPVE